MIFCKSWYEGTYDCGGEPGTGPRFFLGGMAETEDSPVLLIGGVEVAGGWLLFAQRSSATRSASSEAPLPTTVQEYRSFDDQCDDPIMSLILNTDCPGWEWDVVHSVFAERGEFVVSFTSKDSKRAGPNELRHWIGEAMQCCD